VASDLGIVHRIKLRREPAPLTGRLLKSFDTRTDVRSFAAAPWHYGCIACC
jgi:hypothetical protein